MSRTIGNMILKAYPAVTDAVAIADSEDADRTKKTNLVNIRNLFGQLVLEYTTTTPSIILSPNYCIKFSSPISSLTITSLSVSSLESEVQFTTDSTFVFSAAPLTGKWIGGAPNFEPNKTYVIALKNGLAAWGEVS